MYRRMTAAHARVGAGLTSVPLAADSANAQEVQLPFDTGPFHRDASGRLRALALACGAGSTGAMSMLWIRLLMLTLLFCSAGRVQLALFRASEAGYAVYRIPSITVTPRHTVLAFAVGRRTAGSDWAPADILLRRSVDGGRTFSVARRVAGNGEDVTDNPTAVIDRNSGDVLLLFQQNYYHCFIARSHNDGVSFDHPQEITDALLPLRSSYPWTVLAPGPGHGIQTHSGRMVVPVWLAAAPFAGEKKPRAHRPSASTTLISDDGGHVWKATGLTISSSSEIVNPSEAALAETEPGTILMNVRNESPRHRRVVIISHDDAKTWSAPAFAEDLFEPVCEASMVAWQPPRRGSGTSLAFASPDSERLPLDAHQGYARKRLTLRISHDGGLTWSLGSLLDEGDSGYSDLAAMQNGTLLCLYERGRMPSGDPESIALLIVVRPWGKAAR